MSKTITFKDAKQEGIIFPGQYVMVTMPKSRKVAITKEDTGVAGIQRFELEQEQIRFRLEEGLKMWGEPTRKSLMLGGKIGFEQGPDTMNKVIRELYELPKIFEMAKNCSLPEKDHFYSSSKKLYEEMTEYTRPNDKGRSYWLASRCVEMATVNVELSMFFVSKGRIFPYCLYSTECGSRHAKCPVRPEVTANPMLLLETEGCDGSEEKPWKCICK